MIEADIILGTTINSTERVPVMGHPPNTKSDISLDAFLTNVTSFNAANTNRTKGIKLDFKSTEVFVMSATLLQTKWSSVSFNHKSMLQSNPANQSNDDRQLNPQFQLNFPVWINADIIPGPVNNTYTDAVDPDRFLDICKGLPNSTLSIGWTTRWGANFTDGTYTTEQISNMLTAIKNNQINSTTHSITFPVRAGIAANSIDNLQALMAAIDAKNKPTLTIWSSPDDAVNIDKLRKLIFAFGVEKVYIDVPDEVYRQLDLGNARGRASSLIHFGIVTMTVFLLSVVLSSSQF